MRAISSYHRIQTTLAKEILCAFSSPKHERLLSLLDYRDYDRIEIVAPNSDSPRSKVAQIAAAVAGMERC